MIKKEEKPNFRLTVKIEYPSYGDIAQDCEVEVSTFEETAPAVFDLLQLCVESAMLLAGFSNKNIQTTRDRFWEDFVWEKESEREREKI